MTDVCPYGFLRLAAQGFWNPRVVPFDPEVHCVVRVSEVPAIVVPGA
ncbi:hypothetical protein OG285_32560 [Streptomyces sp. NBC_01471]